MQSQGHVKKKRPTVVASLMVFTCFFVEIVNIEFWLCRPTMTLHQAQGHRNEHEHICPVLVYRHAKFECNSLNIARDITS